MAQPLTRETAPGPEWEQLQCLLDRFDRAWQTGTPPGIEEFLQAVPAAELAQDHRLRRQMLQELVAIDIQYRCRHGGGGLPQLEDYVTRFPELGPLDQVSVELIGEEYWARQVWGDRPSHAEYVRRFPRAAGLREALLEIDADLVSELPRGGRKLAQGMPALPASPQPISSIDDLVDALRRNQLLRPAQLDEITRTLVKRFRDAPQLARELLRREWLTPYQVNQLLKGRGQELVLGPYILLERLGEGGAGQVFKARHQKMNRVVALKMIRKDLLVDAEVVGRFYREIQLVGKLDHPNVVHAYDAGPAGVSHFLAMEYVVGTDLGRMVKQAGPLPVMQACAYIRQAALGMQHAHERDLVHRDIKPHNLILSLGEGLVKVTDLGLARLHRAVNLEELTIAAGVETTGTLTPDNTVMLGTADYMAPEQALDFHEADIRADIYSLGCTFYYLLTGRPPFAGGNLAQKVARHMNVEPDPVEQFRADTPAELSAVLKKMLAKRPEDRYQTPAEVAEAIAALLQSAGSQPDPTVVLPARPPQAAAPKRRRFLYTASGAVLLLVSFAGLTLLLGGKAGTGTPSSKKEAPDAVKRFIGRLDENTLTAEQLRAELRELRFKDPEKQDLLRQQLLAARSRYLGTPRALQVGELLMLLPSPLDRLDGKAIPAPRRVGGLEKVLAAVLADPDGSTPMPISGLDFSPDCKTLAATGANNTVRLWDLASSQPRKGNVLSGHTAPVLSIAFSPDGKMLASGSQDQVRLWFFTGKEPVHLPAKGEVRSLAFASDSKTLASHGRRTVQLWDLRKEKPLLRAECAAEGLGGLAFAPDNLTLACGDSNCTRFWDLRPGSPKELPKLETTFHPASLAYSADGKILGIGQSINTSVWDLTGKAPKRLVSRNAINRTSNRVAFTPDGKTLVSSDQEGLVTVSRPDSTVNAGEWRVPGPIRSLALASDGRHIAVGNDKVVYVLRLAHRQ